MKIFIVFCSKTGNTLRLAEAVAVGVREYPGAEPCMRYVPDSLPWKS